MSNCPICSTKLTKRNGKFGEFYFCSEGHGTVSIQADGKLLVKGTMFAWLKQKAIIERGYDHGVYLTNQFLETIVELEMSRLTGFIMTDLDRFVEGGADAALDDPDHWINGRDY